MSHKIGAYLRVSTEEQAAAVEGSLDNQKFRLKSYVDSKCVQEKNWGKLVDFYIDDGKSAKDTNRPAYQRMMLDLKNKKIDLILVADLSRLSRNMMDFCGLLNFLDKHKAGFLSIKEQFDTSTSIGRMMVLQIINLAQFEREQTSERVALGTHARAMRGLLNGGRPILGFDKDPSKPGIYVVNTEEAKAVRQIFDLYLKEGSRSRTIKTLGELGIQPKLHENSKVPTPNRSWSVGNLGYLLSNAAYMGCLEVNKGNKKLDQQSLKAHQKYQIVKAPWPAIVSEEVYEKVQDQLEVSKLAERTRLKDAKPRLYILSGIFKCAECGESLVGQSYHGHGGAYRYYGHTTKGSKNGCKIQRVSADEIEAAVIKHLKENLADSSYFKKLQKKLSELTEKSSTNYTEQIKKLKAEIKSLEHESVNIFRMQAQGNFNSDVLKMMSDRLEFIAKQKSQYNESLKMCESRQSDVFDAKDSTHFIQTTFVDFEKGFDKAPVGLKKRLVRNTFKQVVLAHDKLAMWFYLDSDDQGRGGHGLKLVRDEASEVGVSLDSGANFGVSKLSDRGLDIGLYGEPSFPLSELVHQLDFTPFFPKIKNRISAADGKNIAEMYEKGLSLRDIALQFGCSKSKIRTGIRRLGLKLRDKGTQATHLRSLKSGKQSARPYYGFCYFEGEIVKDPREFPTLQLIHRLWIQGKSIHQINLELNRAKVPSRTGKEWSWAALQNIVARFENKQVTLTKGGKYEFR